MSGGAAAAGAGGAAAAAAIANAIKACGAIVWVEPEEFEAVLARREDPLVVVSGPKWWTKKYRYLTAYKGLVFYTKTDVPFTFEGDFELINATSVSVPG